MEISLAEVDHVAELARLGLTALEREQFRAQLSTILGYVNQLAELDTSHVPPSAQIIQVENVTRPDVVRPGLTVEQVLANAPVREDDYFRVPPVFEE
ncbi:MAG TPA: Asp-tRNA(Asn)/Glu-tRNA(Gln) amidotransferase subunit GatC [Chloroflexota bacterium]|nr:Asp-tRNA(Asn)/Glu-tRNA(Gln) amidotransferase subunit GatC [Chloroflexota bacterium]